MLGVGPKWGLASALCFALAVLGHVLSYPRFVITQADGISLMIVGSLLIATGVSLYLVAVRGLRKGLIEGRLVTTGLYSLLRHPLYASNILFVVPGIALVCKSWLLLCVPLFMYAAFRLFIPAEDRELRKRFGQTFEEYRGKTNAVFPKVWPK
jgi:protein-S-isoprenylcysteine O-methyltransferase Ste14